MNNVLFYHFLKKLLCVNSEMCIKVGGLRPVQQPRSYWDGSSALSLVGLEPTEVTAYEKMPNLLTTKPLRTSEMYIKHCYNG